MDVHNQFQNSGHYYHCTNNRVMGMATSTMGWWTLLHSEGDTPSRAAVRPAGKYLQVATWSSSIFFPFRCLVQARWLVSTCGHCHATGRDTKLHLIFLQQDTPKKKMLEINLCFCVYIWLILLIYMTEKTDECWRRSRQVGILWGALWKRPAAAGGGILLFWEEEMVSKSVGSRSKCPFFHIMNLSFVISKETIRHVLINQPFFISNHPSNRPS